MFMFDQLSHPESVLIRPGGVLEGAECIIAGQIGTVSNDDWSLTLYKKMAAGIKKDFQKIKAFYVGKNAMEKMKDGFRLTSNIKSPAEYDLSL